MSAPRARAANPSDAAIWLTLGAIGALAFAVFARALGNGFVWDDRLILEKQLSAFRSAGDLFFPPRDIPQYSRFYYRPMVVLTYLIDGALGRGSPVAYHLTPILVHALASALAFVLFVRLLSREALAAAAFGAIAFAVHPVHAEVVAWMAGRGDAMAAVGVLGALLLWGTWIETARWPWLAAGGAALLFGLLSKESAMTAVPLAAVLPWVWPARAQRSGRPGALPLWIAIAVSASIYALLRMRVVGVAVGASSAAPASAQEMLAAIGYYACALVWPTSLGAVRTFAPRDAFHAAVGAGALVLGGAALAVFLRRRAFVSAWAIAWIALGLAPPLVLLLRAIAETPVAERYLYVPSAGAALLLACGIERLPAAWRKPTLAVGAAVVLAWSALSVRGAATWRDDRGFWENTAAAVPEEGFARIKLAYVRQKGGEVDAAETILREALSLKLSPGQRAITQNNLGWILLGRKQFAEAEPLFRASVAVGPAIGGPYRGLAESLWLRGEDAAVRREIAGLLEQAMRLDARDARGAFLLGMVRLKDGDARAAAQWFERAIAAKPDSSSAGQAKAMLARMRAGS